MSRTWKTPTSALRLWRQKSKPSGLPLHTSYPAMQLDDPTDAQPSEPAAPKIQKLQQADDIDDKDL